MKLNPYLYFPGSCKEAMTAYAEALGGKIVAMLPYGDMPGENEMPADLSEKIAHACLNVGDQLLMASDLGPSHFQPMQGTAVTLNIPEPAEAERVFNALAEGGAVTMPLEETFWAAKFGLLTDRFGTRWMINCVKPQ